MSFAFFDFDNTLIAGDAGPLFGRYLLAWRRLQLRATKSGIRRILSIWWLNLRLTPYFIWMAVQVALYKLGARRRSAVIRSAYRGLRGVPVETFEGLLDEFVAEVIPARVYPSMVEEIVRHQQAGRRVVVVTTGLEKLISRCLRHFPPGVELIGCRMQEKRGKLTGRVVGPLFGVDKANIILAFCRATHTQAHEAWAYSDHWSDKHMLEVVGNPVVVNPRGTLRRHAAKMGWHVLEPKVAATARPLAKAG